VIPHNAWVVQRDKPEIRHKARVIPRIELAIPPNERVIRHRGSAIARNAWVIQRCERGILHKETSIPCTTWAIPLNDRAIPCSE
jgi:hypothetical protein